MSRTPDSGLPDEISHEALQRGLAAAFARPAASSAGNPSDSASREPATRYELRNEIGLGIIMWGTDYPHPEGTWPQTRKMMVETLHGLPEADIEALLGGNAAEFYGIDTQSLAPLVDRIGPERSLFRD